MITKSFPRALAAAVALLGGASLGASHAATLLDPPASPSTEEVPPEVTENLAVDLGLLNLSSFQNGPHLQFDVTQTDKDKWGKFPTEVSIQNNGKYSCFLGNGVPPLVYKDAKKDELPIYGVLSGASDGGPNLEIKAGETRKIPIGYLTYQDPRLTYRHVWGLYLTARYRKPKAVAPVPANPVPVAPTIPTADPTAATSTAPAPTTPVAPTAPVGSADSSFLQKTMGLRVEWEYEFDKTKSTGHTQTDFSTSGKIISRLFDASECRQEEIIPLKQVTEVFADSNFTITFLVDKKLTPAEFAALPEALRTGLPAEIQSAMVAKDGDLITVSQTEKGQTTTTTYSQWKLNLPRDINFEFRNTISHKSYIGPHPPTNYSPEEYRRIVDALHNLINSAKGPGDKPCEVTFVGEKLP